MKARKYADLNAFFEQTGQTHEWLAERIGVDRSYVSLLRSRRRQPSLGLALAIEKLTGVPVGALISAEERAS